MNFIFELLQGGTKLVVLSKLDGALGENYQDVEKKDRARSVSLTLFLVEDVLLLLILPLKCLLLHGLG